VKKIAGEVRTSAAASHVDLDNGRVPNRIMLLPIGELQARDGRAWHVDDRAHAEEIVTATREHLGQTDFMMDYDHQAVRAPAVAGRASAAGWIRPDAIHVEDDGIYADVEWTSQARSELKDRQYRYVSPHFGHTKEGRVTRIFNAALTNTPALEMAAVASAHGPDDEDDSGVNDMKKIITQLGLAADANEDTIVAAIAGLQSSTSLTSIATALSLATDATAEQIATAAAEAAARPTEVVDLKPIAAALGAAEDSTVEQLATAASTIAAGSVDLHKFVPIETYDALKTRVEKEGEEKAIASVDAAIAAGKIPPANREFYVASATKDPAAFDEFIRKAPVVLKAGEVDTTAAVDGALTDEEKSIASRLGLTEEQFSNAKKETA
jgi:phage I-like protein